MTHQTTAAALTERGHMMLVNARRRLPWRKPTLKLTILGTDVKVRGSAVYLTLVVDDVRVLVTSERIVPDDVQRHRVIVRMDGTIIKDITGTAKTVAA